MCLQILSLIKTLIKNEYVYFFDFFLHLCPCDNCLCLLHLMGLL